MTRVRYSTLKHVECNWWRKKGMSMIWCTYSYRWTISFVFHYNRKYPLRGYTLGVLTHTTACDRLWEGDETLKRVSIYITWLHFNPYFNIRSSVSPLLMDPRGLWLTQSTYFSLLAHAKQLLLVTLSDATAGIGKNGSVTYIQAHRWTDRREVWNSFLDEAK